MNWESMMKEAKLYKDEMTDAERNKAYAKGEEVDHIPYSLSSAETLPPMYGFTMGEFRRSKEVQLEMARRLHEDFGIYKVGVGLGLKRLGAALGSVLEYPENGLDYVIKPLVSDYAVLDRLEVVNPYENESLSGMLNKIQMYKDEFGPSFGFSSSVAGPLTTAVALRSTEDVLKDMRKDKENLHRLLSYCVDCSLAWVKAVYETHGVTSIGINDPVTSMSLISPSAFQEFSKPHLQEFFDGIVKITGKVPGLHICGRTKEIWQDLVDIGFKSFHLDNCESLREIKETVGDKLAISGNVPPVDVMRYGTIDEVIASVRNCIEEGGDNPSGYTVAIGCQIPAGTPKKNLDAYVFASKKYGRYARKGQRPKGLDLYL